jgi:lipopolysaccharide transport system permease protein
MTEFSTRTSLLWRDRVLPVQGVVWALAIRELKSRHRRSLFGLAWALVQPISYLVTFMLIASVLRISSGGLPYPLFAFSALLPWMFFSNTIIRCSSTTVRNAAIVKATALPREIFPAAEVARSLIDLLVSSVGFALLMAWFQVPLTRPMVWLPVLVTLLILTTTVMGLAATTLGTYWRDSVFVMPFGMQLWLLATPVMYSLDVVPPRWRPLYYLNPIVGIVEGFRSVLIGEAGPSVALLGLSLVVTALVGAVVWPSFRYASRYFADAL